MLRVLVVGMTATVGGLENFVIEMCSHMDVSRIHFDFLSRFPDCAYADRIRQMGGTLYTVTRRSKNPLRFYREMKAFFAAHGPSYDVIWDHECMLNDATPLRYAVRAGIPCRIYHSHNPQNMDVSLRGRLQELLHRINRRHIADLATQVWACSDESAAWVCPKGDVPVRVIPNAVDTAAFRFEPAIRQAWRAKLGLESCFVVGHTGRLQYQKNQGFLLKAFAELHSRLPQARLILAGDGPDADALKASARALGIDPYVLFLGFCEDVAPLLQAMDVFAFPSRFEGFGISALEAQCAGLPCVASQAVPKQVSVTPLVTFLPTDAPAPWVEAMLRLTDAPPRRDYSGMVADAGYDLTQVAQRLSDDMMELSERSRSPFRRRFILSVPHTATYAHALTKARQDVERFALEAGFRPLPMRVPDSAHGNRLKQLGMLAGCAMDWLRLWMRLRKGDMALMQYPHFPLKSAPLARWSIRLLQRRGCRFIALIHDLDSLRGIGGKAAIYSDAKLLPVFDGVICHNEAMRALLRARGLPDEKLVSLELFDYGTDARLLPRSFSRSCCVAGNLSPEKCGYLYELLGLKPLPFTLHLYGGAYEGAETENVIYHGTKPADLLPELMEGAFGLVWDGDGVDGCGGVYGDYLKRNNPHKMSLYLAGGMPVVIWKAAAQARFVEENGVGFAVASLRDIPKALDAITEERYAVMAQNARGIAAKVRAGYYLKKALKAVERFVS